MNKIKNLMLILSRIVLYGLSYLMPKKKSLWVFGAWFGQRYSDNPKAFFEYINKNQKHIKAVWICKDKALVNKLRAVGYLSYLDTSFMGILMQLRAEYAFVCQSLHDDLYPACIGKKTKVVNLWHGLPLKKIMYDVFGEQIAKKNLIGRLFDALSPYEQHRNDYLLATSEETQATLSKAFRLSKSRTLITGFPRNDVFLNPKPVVSLDETYKCIYMPTFRGGMDSECDLFAQFGFDVKLIDEMLTVHNIKLVLRMHPVNKPPQYLIEEIKQSKSIIMDVSADLYDTIASYDCMVTDYSGGYFDFLLTGRPILFAPFDLEKYKRQERDLYYPYEYVTLKPYAYSWPELISNICAVKQGDFPEGYQQSYESLKKRFHQPIAKNAIGFSENLYQKLSNI